MMTVEKKGRYVFKLILLGLVLNLAEVKAQDLIVKDTLAGDLILPIDTTITLIMPNNLEYIPADATPQLIADRLGCLQKTIELTYNSKVHSFIDYFTMRVYSLSRMVK